MLAEFPEMTIVFRYVMLGFFCIDGAYFLLQLFLLLSHLLHLFAIQPFLFLVRDLCLFAFQLLASRLLHSYVCTVFSFSDGVSMALSVAALSFSTSWTDFACLSTVSVPYVRLLR